MLVVICCPAEGRDWCLGRWVRRAVDLELPNGWSRRVGIAAREPWVGEVVSVLMAYGAVDCGFVEQVPEAGGPAERPQYSYEYLAAARNLLLDRAFGLGADAVLMVDSDVLLEAGGLVKLLDTGRNIVAAPVRNSENPGCMNFLYRAEDYALGNGKMYRRPIDSAAFPVSLTGACMLIRREVWETGVRYFGTDKPTRISEDEGFANEAMARGHALWMRPDITTEHLMDSARPDKGLVCAHREGL